MTSSKYEVIRVIHDKIDKGEHVPRDLFKEITIRSNNEEFLNDFAEDQFKVLISGIFLKLDEFQDQLDLVKTISNVLLINEKLRSTNDPELIALINLLIPNLKEMLNIVSERQINSEDQYKDYLPIFRLFFILTHNKLIVYNLKESIIKISKKLLNFISLSSLDSINLNTIIIEILKIIFSYVHQVNDMAGLDSPFVLSFNKFQLIYSKSKNDTNFIIYDEILQHFGNILITISPEISRTYMINIFKFVKNQVFLVNKLINNPSLIKKHNIMTNSLVTLQVSIKIDSEDKVKEYINKELNLDELNSMNNFDPNFIMVLNDLKAALLEIEIMDGFSNLLSKSNQNSNENLPRFEDLTPEEQEKELDEMNEIFDKIERNGVFKIQTKDV